MEITLREIDQGNYGACIELRVGKAQERFVASNLFSLVQAAYEPQMYPLAIYRDGGMVGFILYDYDDELDGWSMSRFMVDEKYQGQGIGRQALAAFIAFFRRRYPGCVLHTSAEVENAAAIALYEAFGFEKREVFEYTAGGNHYREVRMVAKP